MGLLPLRRAYQEASALFASSDVLATTRLPLQVAWVWLATSGWTLQALLPQMKLLGPSVPQASCGHPGSHGVGTRYGTAGVTAA